MFLHDKLRTIKKLVLTLCILVTLCSCASGNTETDSNNSATIAYDTSLAKGIVIDSIACKNASQQTYAIYLPSYYNSNKPFPCIYFFDAHARGSLPLYAYKQLAEKYGFVLIGSNVSKNGTSWEATSQLVQQLMEDSRSRININSDRIYTSGFSGGSRVASWVAINNGGIAGVIGCAAGLPERQGLQHIFNYMGIAGEYDFNLHEMAQLDQLLQQNNFSHQLLSFRGIHSWPPIAEMETALQWMQVNAIKAHTLPANDGLISALRSNWDQRISTAQAEPIKQQQLIEGIIRVLDGIDATDHYKKQLSDLLNSNAYKEAVSRQNQLQEQEQQLQQQLAQQFPNQNLQWWSAKLKELNQAAHVSNIMAANMYHRITSYLGLIGYMYTSRALNNNDMSHAAEYIQVFKLADPKNPDVSYLTAIYYIRNNEKEKCILALQEAASSGYNDLATLRAEPLFQSIHDDVSFRQAEHLMIENLKRP